MPNQFAVHFRNRASGWFHSVEHVVAESADEAVQLAHAVFDEKNGKNNEHHADYSEVVQDLGKVAEEVKPVVEAAAHDPAVQEAAVEAVRDAADW